MKRKLLVHGYRNSLCVWMFSLIIVFTANAQDIKQTGEIRGKITAPPTDDLTESILRGRSLSRYSTHQSGTHEAPQPYTLPEKAAIYIETLDNAVEYDPPDDHPQMNQADMMFRPLVLPILVGTTVDFPNNDNLFHNVFSFSQPKEFDLGRYPHGQKKSITFDKAGVVKVYCDIHSYMYATILVLKNPYFAIPDDEGNYSIPNIPPGKYQVSFWFGRKKVETKIVTVNPSEVSTAHFGSVHD